MKWGYPKGLNLCECYCGDKNLLFRPPGMHTSFASTEGNLFSVLGLKSKIKFLKICLKSYYLYPNCRIKLSFRADQDGHFISRSVIAVYVGEALV